MSEKTEYMKYFLLVILIVFIGCAGEELPNVEVPLKGKWVDINTTTDTLTFGLLGDKKAMILGRGKEIKDGHLLPKMGSGSYDYDLLSDEIIALRSHLSSNSNFHEYYFQHSGDILTVEKFFENSTSGTILTFRKIK